MYLSLYRVIIINSHFNSRTSYTQWIETADPCHYLNGVGVTLPMTACQTVNNKS